MAGALAQLFGEHAQVRGPRVFGAVHAMAETWNLGLAREGVLNGFGGGFLVAQAEQPFDHLLIGAAMQRAFQSADPGGDGRVDVRKRSRHHAGGESGGVQLVIGVQR